MERNKRITIDLSIKDTEAGWIERLDGIYVRLVPAWFQLIGWVALIGGVEYLNRKSHSWVLGAIVWWSLLLMFFYLSAIFYRVEIVGISDKWSRRTQAMVSFVGAGVVVWGVATLAWKAVFAIASAQP